LSGNKEKAKRVTARLFGEAPRQKRRYRHARQIVVGQLKDGGCGR
jgi:hypothetical protein